MGVRVSKPNEDVDPEENNLLDDDEEFVTTEGDYGAGVRSLSFSAIPEQRLSFDDANLKRLIPGCDLRVAFQDSFIRERRSWYTFELEHGCFRWSLRRRFVDFVHLHQQLQIYRTFLSMQIPEIKIERDEQRRRSTVVIHTRKIPKVPSFPLNVEAFSRRKDLIWKMAALENYLQSVLKIPCFRDYHETIDFIEKFIEIGAFYICNDASLEFLEIGPFSFFEDLGAKGKEGYIKRRSNCGDTHLGMMCTAVCGFWKKRWLFLKENFLALIDPSRGELECVLLLDKAFRTKSGRMRTGRSDVLVVQNLSRRLIMQCESERQATDWAEEINFVLDRGSADFVTPNRYESFAPPRSLSECKWIVDGATYFEAVALAMDAAKEEIFIADWWLSPEIYLKRPTTHGHYWQLDYLLRRKAREGVKIYILLYKELELALGINSYHTHQKLSRMHPNIQVLRHPYVSKGVLLWAHHEKIVCIDQTYAFVGGIDLCYGRWDDYQHRLTDLGDAEERIRVKRHMSTFNNESFEAVLSRKTSSLPDITEAFDVEGEIKEGKEEEEFAENGMSEEEMSGDIENQRQSKTIAESSKFVKAFRKYQARKVFENIKRKLSSEEMGQESKSLISSSFFSEQPANLHRNVQKMALMHLGLERKFRLWHGKDYVNFISRDFQELDKPYSDSIDRNTTPRMPWHDVGIYVQGMVARDIARHFILRWNHAKEEICRKDCSKPYLMPKCYSNLVETAPNILQDTVGSLYRAECQVLRSLCFWSGNISDTENSIHKAYVNVIREAKKFIYIENQFFISQPSGNGNVYNGIADALFNRILKAYRDRVDFRVYIILPLLPAFEGEVGSGTGTLIQAITHWNYKSVCRGTDSLRGRLSKYMKDPSKYIGFYGLRTHGNLGNKPVTELIYVHSKLLIADDRVAIIGSANINDRSLLGRRDSEIAVIVKDTNFLDEPPGAGQFCFSLRTALFKEHLGLMQEADPRIDLRDPSSLEFYRNVWNKTAESNTKIYEEVFRCIPTDNVSAFVDLKKFLRISNLASVDPNTAREKLKKIRGYVVLFPLFFLCDEKLEPYRTTKEHYLPSSIFT